MAKNIHVVYRSESKDWAVKAAGSDEVLKTATLKKDAVKLGRELAKAEKSELLIHKKNGRITEKDSFGNDPESVKG